MEPSTIIALVSLVISLSTLVFTHLRPAKITAFIGPNIHLGYPSPGGVSMNIPVTFSNHGAQVGSIFRAAATIYHRDSPHQRYFMLWDSFMKLDIQTTPRWVNDEMAHVLTVPGKSIVAKNILFAWYPSSQPPIVLREGIYKVVFLYWTSELANPHMETHQVVVSSSHLEAFRDTGDPAKPRSAIIQLDQQLESNKLMNEHEFSVLLGQKLRESG